MPRGKPGGGQWTGQDEGDEGASLLGDAGNDDLLQLVNDGGGYPVDILDEEALGGHTVERHVAKPEEYLKARILNNRINIPLIGAVGEKRAGSFTSLEAANKLVNSTLSQVGNAERVEAFVRGDLLYRFPTMYLHSDFDRPTGYEAYSRNDRSQPVIRPTYGVTVQVRRTDRIEKGFFVERAWPTNRD